MTLRNRIRSWIDRFRNRKFRDSVKQEKKRNYLFQKEEVQFQSVRAKPQKKSSPVLQPFSSFFRKIHFENGHPYAVAIGVIGTILVGLSVYIVFFSPYFRVSPSRVIVESLNGVVDLNLAYKGVENTYGSFIFSVDTDKIAKNVMTLQKQIRDVEVRRLYPNGMKVLIATYEPIFETRIAFLEKDFFLTENGVLVPAQKRKGENLSSLEIVSRTLHDELFLDYKMAISAKMIASIRIAKETLEKQFPDLKFGLFRYFPNERELHISLESGSRILLSLDDTIKNALTNELVTLQIYAVRHREELQKGGITYIDARTVGKLFVCRDQKACQKNLADIYGDVYR